MSFRVLLVDDEPGIRKVLEIYLEDAGYDVVTTGDGNEAARILEKDFFNIVLSDIRMPGMDGISLLKKIKEKSGNTEVIMITGHGDLKLAVESLKLDAVDFITKPIDNDILDIALKRAQDRIRTREQILQYTQNLEELVKEKTQKLEESEKRYIQLFNESPSYITIQDKDLNIVETNKIFKDHFGYDSPKTCHMAYKKSPDPCVDCPVIKSFKDGKSHSAEMDIVRKDGSIRNILIQTSAITDSSGKIVNVMEMSTDVTMIRELQDHLAALGLHIGSISHGIKQVLTGLDGGSYMVESGLEKNDSQLIQEGWEQVKEKMVKTRQMVLDILYHSKKRELEKSKVRLNDYIREITGPVKQKAKLEKIGFNVEFLKEDVEIEIDKMAINAVFSSILENAVDACLDRKDQRIKPKIDFAISLLNQNAVFSITDNGKGIKKDQQENIFDLFYSEKGNKGTGLGLFIAQRSVKQHNGTIKVESEPGKFTRFTITLPFQAK